MSGQEATDIEIVRKLEKSLFDRTAKCNASILTGITVMLDDENGCTISYVRGMPIKHTGQSEQFYNKASKYFNPKYKHIDWPYTGFVRGNLLGWEPISIPELINFLKRYHYPLDLFAQRFSEFAVMVPE